jgi:exopolysaccharide biosynthesis polyprenyl glycosylphosphotransferase
VSPDEAIASNRSTFLSVGESVATPRQNLRLNQTVACHALSLVEAVAVSLVAAAALSLAYLVPQTSRQLIAMSAVAVLATVLCASLASGAANFDRFASRLAILPVALASGAVTGWAALLGGAHWYAVLICGVTLFASVYIAKIPTTLIKLALQSKGYLSRCIAVVGEDAVQRGKLIAKLQGRPDIEILYAGPQDAMETLSRMSGEAKLDEILLIGPCDKAMMEKFSGLDVTLALVADLPCHEKLLRIDRASMRWVAPVAIVSTAPLRGWNTIAKRAIDISGSLTALILLSPIMLACALAVKLESPGPVFFVQERQGYRNKPFRMFKFRSMRAAMTDHRGSQLTLRNDPRVTRVGNLLRRSSADELPQLFNVLIGNMSLVGPRPHPIGVKAGNTAYDELIPNFYARYRMKPGLTGLAQISGLRGNTETEKHLIDRFDQDLLYAARWTPLLDIVIMGRTVLHLLKGTNAF